MHSPNLEEVKPLQEEVVNPNFGMVIKTYDKREMKNFISPGEDNGDNPGDDPDENPDEDLDENSVEEVQIQESIKHDNSGISMNNHIKEVIDQYEIEQIQSKSKRKRARTANRHKKKKSMFNN